MCHGIANDPGNLSTISSGNRSFRQLHIEWMVHDVQSDFVRDQKIKGRMWEKLGKARPVSTWRGIKLASVSCSSIPIRRHRQPLDYQSERLVMAASAASASCILIKDSQAPQDEMRSRVELTILFGFGKRDGQQSPEVKLVAGRKSEWTPHSHGRTTWMLVSIGIHPIGCE
jgi:hypothetical protein